VSIGVHPWLNSFPSAWIRFSRDAGMLNKAHAGRWERQLMGFKKKYSSLHAKESLLGPVFEKC
jgi:hypothetical protein